MKFGTFLALAIVTYATSAGSQEAVRLIDSEAAKQCTFVDTQITAAIAKMSDFGKWDQAADSFEQKFRISAKDRASKARGNAIVYRDLTASGTLPMLMFDIYNCPETTKRP